MDVALSGQIEIQKMDATFRVPDDDRAAVRGDSDGREPDLEGRDGQCPTPRPRGVGFGRKALRRRAPRPAPPAPQPRKCSAC